MSPISIRVENLCFSYGEEEILKNLSFQVPKGQLVTVLGPNGAGKSTLFRCILGLLNPTSGGVFLDNTPIGTLSVKSLAQKIAYVPQSHYLAFQYSVLDMVLMGTATQLSAFALPREREKNIAMEALARLGIEYLAPRSYLHLSGGERQLVLLARALTQQTDILILDEPISSLDFGNQLLVLEQVRTLAREGFSILLSCHNPEQAYRYSDQILALYNHEVLAFGTPQQVITPDIMSTLYGLPMDVTSLFEDTHRVCIPPNYIARKD